MRDKNWSLEAGNALTQWMAFCGYTTEQKFAAAIAQEMQQTITSKTISNWIKGKWAPRSELLEAAAATLRVPSEDLRNGVLPPETNTRFRQKHFYATWRSVPRIREVLKNWGEEVHEIVPISVTGDVQHDLRNSNRYKIVCQNATWFLREILRKAISEQKRLKSKHNLVRWLFENLGFPTIPLEKQADGTDLLPPLELYKFVPHENGYKIPGHRYLRSKLAAILVSMDQATQQLLSSHPDLAAELRSRFTHVHQYEGIDIEALDHCYETIMRQERRPVNKREEIKTLHKAIHTALEGGLEARIDAISQEEPERIIHGDLTPDNLIVRTDNEQLYVVDWDVVRLVRSGHFDIAFALTRLSYPLTEPPSHTVSDREKKEAKEFHKVILDTFDQEDVEPPTEDSMAKGLDQVAFEFVLRMSEYFQPLAEGAHVGADSGYIHRCNPLRPFEIKALLFPEFS